MSDPVGTRTRFSSVILGAIAMLAALAQLPGLALAQEPLPPPFPGRIGSLTNVPGQTPYELAVSNTIDRICPFLPLAPNTPTGDLQARCTQLKGTASQLQGQPLAAGAGLGLSNSQLASVMGFWSQDQATENSRAAIEMGARQVRAIAGRMTALRLGARGISVGGLFGPGETKTFSWNQILNPEGAGGAASADDTGIASRFGVFVNGTYAWGDKDTTDREIGFDFDIGGVIAGVDYRFTENLIFGIALNYAYTAADFDSNLGDTNTNSFGGVLYGTYYVKNFFIDGYFGFNWNWYDATRRIVYSAGPGAGPLSTDFTLDRTAKADPDGQAYSFGVATGYDFTLGAWTLTPLIRADFIGLNVDSYTETGADGLNLKVATQKQTSFVTGLGAQVTYAISVPFGVLLPQVRAEWRHEFLNDSRGIRAQFAADPFALIFAIPTDNPTRNYAALSVGLAGVFKGGWQAFLNYDGLFGLKDITYNQITAGVRYEF